VCWLTRDAAYAAFTAAGFRNRGNRGDVVVLVGLLEGEPVSVSVDAERPGYVG
jgi:hypothetical protein